MSIKCISRLFAPLDKNRVTQKKSYLTGFTLLEILISALILALVALGLACIFFAARKNLLHTRSKVQGAELGRLFFAPLQMDVTLRERTSGAQNGWGQVNNCLSSDGTSPACPPVQRVDNVSYTPTYNISDLSGTTLRKVKVTINWTEPTP